MLIECSECGKQISDKAPACPHCGCPLQEIETDNYCNINGVSYNLQDVIDTLPKLGYGDTDIHPYYIIGMIRDRTPLDPNSSEELANIIIETKQIPKTFSGEESPEQESSSQVTCPYCKSNNVRKISGTERAVSVIGLGLFSKKINKSFMCENCKGTF